MPEPTNRRPNKDALCAGSLRPAKLWRFSTEWRGPRGDCAECSSVMPLLTADAGVFRVTRIGDVGPVLEPHRRDA
jgi:hypothetical protein